MSVRTVALAALAGPLVLGCTDTTGPSAPDGAPSVEGTMLFWSSIPTPPDVTPGVSIRIQRVDPPCTDITVSVTFTPERFAVREADGTLETATYDDLAEGITVRVWVPDPAVTCPYDGSATFVELVP